MIKWHVVTDVAPIATSAIGFSRVPLVRANLHGHWPRKKRWNFWNWISPRFVLQVTLADIDYAAFCQVTIVDFERKRTLARTEIARPGSIVLPEHVARTVSFQGRSIRYANVYGADGMQVDLSGTARSGEPIVAAFFVHVPTAQESLNVVVPWSAARFQANSKHNTLPCTGEVRVGDVRYSQADISRTRGDLGYDPDVTFEQGLARTLEWYRATSKAA